LGFQTQKPVSLLERIIEASSNEGDWVLDPFCGCGTAIDAAEKLNRHWVGIDVTYLAVNIIKRRMRDSYPSTRFRIEGEPQELEAAKELATDRYQFQWWALSLIGARPVGSSSGGREGKKGADDGIDGWLRFSDGSGLVQRIVVQVKSGHVGVKDIRELRDVVSRQKAAIGIFITLDEPTSEMIKEVKSTEPFKHPTWQHEYPKLQILTVAELLKGKMPDIPPTTSPYQEAPLAKRAQEGKNETLR
jgi:site-specific DNA-methyltransferase (adenine-specific)